MQQLKLKPKPKVPRGEHLKTNNMFVKLECMNKVDKNIFNKPLLQWGPFHASPYSSVPNNRVTPINRVKWKLKDDMAACKKQMFSINV